TGDRQATLVMARLPKNPRPQVAVFIRGQASVPAGTVVNRPPLPASRAVATPTCGEVNEGPAKLRAANERAPIPGPPTGATPKERALTLAPPKRATPKGRSPTPAPPKRPTPKGRPPIPAPPKRATLKERAPPRPKAPPREAKPNPPPTPPANPPCPPKLPPRPPKPPPCPAPPAPPPRASASIVRRGTLGSSIAVTQRVTVNTGVTSLQHWARRAAMPG